MSIIGKSLSKEGNAGIPFGPIHAGENPHGVSAGLKWAVSGAFILALLSLGGSAFLYRSLNTETRERQALEAAQDQMRGKSANLEKNLQKGNALIEELQAKLKEHETSQGQFKKVIEDNAQVIVSLQEKLKATEAVINQISEPEPEEASSELPLDESSLDLPEEPGAAVQPEEQAPEPPTAAVPAAAEPKSTALPVPPPPPVVAPAPAPVVSAAPVVKPLAHKPQVLSVNRKFNFIVIGLGIKDGIQMGDAIEVSREGKGIGDAQVEKLYENFAAATIMHEDKEAPIKEGDSIRKSSP